MSENTPEIKEVNVDKRQDRNNKIAFDVLSGAIAAGESEKKNLFSVVGLLRPKPSEQWDVNDYALAIDSFSNIQGEAKEVSVASKVREYLYENAKENNIDESSLREKVNKMEHEEKSLGSFVDDAAFIWNNLSRDAQQEKVREIQEFPAELQQSVQSLFRTISRPEPEKAPESAPRTKPYLKGYEGQHISPQIEAQLRQEYEQDESRRRVYEGEKVDMDLYQGSIAETLEKRFERIEKGYEDEDKLRSYYADIQKWVSQVLQNDSRENPDGKLVLSNERYAHFKKIVGATFEETSMKDIKENVAYLKDQKEGRLTRYFQTKDGEDNDRMTPVTGWGRELKGWYPQSLEEVVDMIQAQYGSKYATGGEFEMFDVNGEFHLENFYYWARERTNYIRNSNPVDAISPLEKIIIRSSMSAIPLSEVLQSPQYRKHKKFEIFGDERNEGEGESTIDGHWGQEVEHPKFTEEIGIDLINELGFYAQDHSFAVNYHYKRGEKDSFVGAMENHMRGWQARGNWFGIYFRRPSRREDGFSEYDGYFDNGEEGTLGRGMREMLVAYTHLTDFTDYDTYQDGDRRLIKNDNVERTVGERKKFDDNLFYKYLESDGANAFLLSVAEESMNKNKDAQKLYGKFLYERIGAAYDTYVKKGLNDEQEMLLKQLVGKYQDKVKGSKSIAFDASDDLMSFHTQAKRLLFNEKVDKKQIALDVQEDLMNHINEGFFQKVKDIEVDTYEGTYGEYRGKKKVGDIIGKELSAMMTGDYYEQYKKYVDYRRLGKSAPDTKSEDFEKFVQKNEAFALKMAKVFANRGRKDLNYFRKSDNHYSKDEIIDKALEKGICRKALGLNKVDSEYAMRWTKNMLYPFGIAGANDTTNTGFDYYTRILRAANYLEAQGMKGYPVVDAFIDEFRMLNLNFFDMLMVRRAGEEKANMTLMDIFRGGTGDNIKSRDQRLLADASAYELPPNSQYNVFTNAIKNGADLVDKLRNSKFNFEQLTKHGQIGGVIIDKQRAISEFTKLWTNIRYCTDQHGMNYTRLMSWDGKIDDVLHHQFGKRTRTILQDMQETMYKEDPMKMLSTPGIGAFTSLVGAIIEQHDGLKSDKKWTLEQISQLEYVISAVIHKDPRVKGYATRIPPHIWDAMLVMTKLGGYKQQMSQEGVFAFFESLYYIFAEGIDEYFEEVGRPLHK